MLCVLPLSVLSLSVTARGMARGWAEPCSYLAQLFWGLPTFATKVLEDFVLSFFAGLGKVDVKCHQVFTVIAREGERQ